MPSKIDSMIGFMPNADSGVDFRPNAITPNTNDPEELEQYLGSIYPITDKEQAEIDNKHTYHAPSKAQIKAYPLIREKAKELEILIRRLCPPSRERSVAITQIETGVFWANAAKARNEKDDPDFSGEDH